MRNIDCRLPVKASLMHESARLIAIDWGTSSARAYALDANGGFVSERSAALGIQRVTDLTGSIDTGVDATHE